ncbi:nitronate monooxygenase family protein [Solitalea sp. MAHUQ-68]|uniref:Nitronate monooxygenase family protein n=1 Tax=Solitalea agri TaxID=2953739 RepID=A0A9X2F8F8_9SPHI|nr:nitronate monooxygenase family protein [Solitalea agri]MCO4293658.1 nitronate monooxygenase family protein [Solitalea agri]
MKISNKMTKELEIEYPIIMAPMFLVSNEAMMRAAISSGIMGVFPSLNYRNEGELAKVLSDLQSYKELNPEFTGNYGVNLIVQRSNPLFEKHLRICGDHKVPFYITSLGNPKPVIELAHSYGGKVYCDVTNIEHAAKCASLGCDGFIAVGQGAGGHAGPSPLHLLVPSLKHHFPAIPVIAAGGIANGEGILSALSLGAQGVSIGTRFINSTESTVSNAYKQSIIDAKMEDIVLTEKLSGTPCNIINTPYAQKMGYKQNWFEKLLSSNKTTKKYFKMLVQVKGMKKLEAAIHPNNYKTLWCAGQSVELINDILPTSEITKRLVNEVEEALINLQHEFSGTKTTIINQE